MPAVPSFVLRKLYVQGSLQNTERGCQLQIKNTLAQGTITGVAPLAIDGVAHNPVKIELSKGGDGRSAADLSSARPFAFDLNTVVTILVKGLTLEPGEHRINIDVTTREAGRLKFDVTDKIA